MPPTKSQREENLKKAKALREEDVLNELEKQGVTDLDTLVRERLDEVRSLGVEEAGSVLIYKCFILADWD